MDEKQSGFLLVDKPAGITSHDVISKLRRITGVKRIGHAGTLDPFATGLLIVGVGREATRDLGIFLGQPKTYEAGFVLGATTKTLDPEGEIMTDLNTDRDGLWHRNEIEGAIKSFIGDIQQIPPMYSAIKKNGQKMYDLARQGKTVELEPRSVTIYEFEMIGEAMKDDGSGTRPARTAIIKVRIRCSAGTYIRALARDLAIKLGTIGYVQALRRTKIGEFDISQSKPLSEITPENWQSLLINLPS